MPTIVNNFPVTETEYQEIERRFGKLAHKAAWQLKQRNSGNNFPEDQEDIVQELRIAMLQSGSYFKRQAYIESSFGALEGRVRDPFMGKVVDQLRLLWKNRKRHGAGKQKFGDYQEVVLERLLKSFVPKPSRPRRDQPLNLDVFASYCKTSTWNRQKNMGKKITREKPLRSGMVSLGEFDFLAQSI